MSADLIIGAVAFVFFFGMWVVVPNLVHKKNHAPEEDEG